MKPDERFTILQSVANDHVGETFQTVKKDGQGLAAVKVFHASVLENSAACSAYEDAVRRLHAIGPARAPRPVALHLEKDNGWTATEWVSTDTLAAFARRLDRFEGEVAAGIGCGILDALSEMHSASVVHGALTPHKIWLSQGFLPGGVILGQPAENLLFGGQPALQEGQAAAFVTQEDAAYLAPEQVRDGSADIRSDLYAVGAILYELLTGTPLYEGSAEEILQAHVDTPAPKAAVHSNVSQDISDILEIALNKDPEQRFQTAIAMRRALAHCRKSGDEASEQASAPLGMQRGQNIAELLVINTLTDDDAAEKAAAEAAAAEKAAQEAAAAEAAAAEAAAKKAAEQEAAEKAADEQAAAAAAKEAAEKEAADKAAAEKAAAESSAAEQQPQEKKKQAAAPAAAVAPPASAGEAADAWFALSKDEDAFKRLHGEEEPPPLVEINRRYRRKSAVMIAAIVVLGLVAFAAVVFFGPDATSGDKAESQNTPDFLDEQPS